jgi:hypothetical protein
VPIAEKSTTSTSSSHSFGWFPPFYKAFPPEEQATEKGSIAHDSGNPASSINVRPSLIPTVKTFDGMGEVPYLMGFPPPGKKIEEVEPNELAYGRPLCEQEIRARLLYWGKAPQEVTKALGLPKFDGRDFFPPSPVQSKSELAERYSSFPTKGNSLLEDDDDYLDPNSASNDMISRLAQAELNRYAINSEKSSKSIRGLTTIMENEPTTDDNRPLDIWDLTDLAIKNGEDVFGTGKFDIKGKGVAPSVPNSNYL